MSKKRRISVDEARMVGSTLAIDWSKVALEQFRRGLEVELEHGARDPDTNVTCDDLTLTGKIAWAHLKEFPDYYTRLDQLEAEADGFWATRREDFREWLDRLNNDPRYHQGRETPCRLRNIRRSPPWRASWPS